jgi:hypothetical protein
METRGSYWKYKIFLLKGSQRMFLWAALQIKSLCTMKTDNDICLALADLPKDLPETRSLILRKSDQLDYQRRVLQFVAVARRSLTTEELMEALSVVLGHNFWDPTTLISDAYSTLACCLCPSISVHLVFCTS